jgi:hypothetical protein
LGADSQIAKPVHLEGLDPVRVRGDKITEVWIEYDNLAAMQQMGAIPTSG